MMQTCFHCREPIPPGVQITLNVDGVSQPMCCQGCRAVAELIGAGGWDQYYQFRTEPGTKPDAEPSDWSTYDRQPVIDRLTEPTGDHLRRTSLVIEGLRCAACIWLLDRALNIMPGVEDLSMDLSTGRASITWDPERLALSQILARVESLGYAPAVSGTSQATRNQAQEAKSALQRLIVAGIAAMQVMMYSVGLYAGLFQGMDEVTRDFLRWFACLVATPAVLYSAYPFYLGAWYSVRQLRPNMDVPVTLALAVALCASIYAMVVGLPEVYFDSAAMFVFFLSIARYFEMRIRHRARTRLDSLSRLIPDQVLRKTAEGYERIGTVELTPGDLIQVGLGERLAADGRIVDGKASLDESLLTGESEPVDRTAEDTVLAGSLVVAGTIEVEVNAMDSNTLISDVIALAERAQSVKPGLTSLADRIAGGLVLTILAVAALTGLYWYWADPSEVISATLAVLVITCPCAVALATPTARAAAAAALTRCGVLVTNAEALERLATVDYMLWDKTGTLTQGKVVLTKIEVLDPALTEAQAVNIAAALEQYTLHPLAAAFASAKQRLNPGPVAPANEVTVVPGKGLTGRVDEQNWKLGRPDFCGAPVADRQAPDQRATTTVALGNGTTVACLFYLRDPIKTDAAATLKALEARGLESAIASGDSAGTVSGTAATLNLSVWHAGLLPQDKAALLQRLRSEGRRVAMFGDGINDAPALAGADVAIAMDDGTALAKRQADIILMGNHLQPLTGAIDLARRLRLTVRQNLTWALAYNFVAVPLAAAGAVPPWLAALGMSLSSIAVVLNSSRLSTNGLFARQSAGIDRFVTGSGAAVEVS